MIYPGTYVINKKNTEWGIGQVQTIVKNKVTVNFENAGKLVINTEVVKLDIINLNEKT
ncbi:MAG: hypothetical protein CFH01_00196 [Alphaproteobacteria bacterium MarineAlpha2_Bin1]|nr:MAG: hypothetical protein CFH01_00196 [Alphaproteobacteria bacterium MarineAlpha2_Bin1]|tara:strand:+ start:730 stop:903 length:174 start_codon:yes stop_codon:yes gene_type:complete